MINTVSFMSVLSCCVVLGLNHLPMPSAWVPTWESRGENSTAKVENYKVRREMEGRVGEWRADKLRDGMGKHSEMAGRRWVTWHMQMKYKVLPEKSKKKGGKKNKMDSFAVWNPMLQRKEQYQQSRNWGWVNWWKEVRMEVKVRSI